MVYTASSRPVRDYIIRNYLKKIKKREGGKEEGMGEGGMEARREGGMGGRGESTLGRFIL